MRKTRDIECWLTDMDGVLVHEEQPLPGAAELIQRWVDTSKRFLVLTNNSLFTARDLAEYDPAVRVPVRRRIGDWEFAINPPPSVG